MFEKQQSMRKQPLVISPHDEAIVINKHNKKAKLEIGVIISLSFLLFDARFATVFKAR
jgi:hypothetical protein